MTAAFGQSTHQDLSHSGARQTVSPKVLAALQDSERRFRASMEHSPIGMALTAMDGTWLDVNPALCNFLGYTKEQLMAAGFKKVTHPNDRDATILLARKMVASHQKSVTLEKRYIHANGEILIGLLSITVVRDDNDTPLMYISQILDVTASRRLDNLKSEFITTVNHELRTPLTAIIGALGLLEQFSTGSLPEVGQKLVGAATKNAARLKSLLDDVLEMESLSADIFEPFLESVDLAEIIPNVVTALEPKATAANIHLDCMPFDGSLTCATDPVKLTRVASILVSNAIKFSDPGGVVKVEAKTVQKMVRITVSNKGRPIPEKMHDLIFQPFVQAEPTNNRRKEGAGLGLAIAKQLVEHLRGDIGYVSNVDITKFWVDIPISSDASLSQE